MHPPTVTLQLHSGTVTLQLHCTCGDPRPRFTASATLCSCAELQRVRRHVRPAQQGDQRLHRQGEGRRQVQEAARGRHAGQLRHHRAAAVAGSTDVIFWDSQVFGRFSFFIQSINMPLHAKRACGPTSTWPQSWPPAGLTVFAFAPGFRRHGLPLEIPRDMAHPCI